jgi:hypothetical protein
VEFTPEGAILASSANPTARSDVELTAEAFARLVYGRLDPIHTPAFDGDPAVLDGLRATYPGP